VLHDGVSIDADNQLLEAVEERDLDAMEDAAKRPQQEHYRCHAYCTSHHSFNHAEVAAKFDHVQFGGKFTRGSVSLARFNELLT
jgi:hypothetical protein